MKVAKITNNPIIRTQYQFLSQKGVSLDFLVVGGGEVGGEEVGGEEVGGVVVGGDVEGGEEVVVF